MADESPSLSSSFAFVFQTQFIGLANLKTLDGEKLETSKPSETVDIISIAPRVT